MRKNAQKSQKEIAIEMEITTSFLSRLEHGNRQWTRLLIAKFRDAVCDIKK